MSLIHQRILRLASLILLCALTLNPSGQIVGVGSAHASDPGAGAPSSKRCLASQWLKEKTILGKDFVAKEWRTYRKELRESPGIPYFRKRFFIMKRDQTQTRNPIKSPGQWVFNPIATIFNTKTQVTMPVSTLATAVIFTLGDLATEHLNSKANQDRLKNVDQVPGGQETWELTPSGALDENHAADLISSHSKTLHQWFSSRPGETALPRISAFMAEKLLTEEEAHSLDLLARYAITKAQAQDPQHVGKKATELLMELVDQDPKFAKKDLQIRDSLGTALWPLPKIGKHTDVELRQRIVSAATLPDEKATSTESKSLRLVNDLLVQGLKLGDGYLMAEATLTEPKQISKKLEKASKILPQDKLTTAQRPDVPIFRMPYEFKYSTHSTELKDELDHWRLLLNDPRFADLANSWLEGRTSDYETLILLRTQLSAFNQLGALREKIESNTMDAKDLDALYGLDGRSSANILLLPSRELATKLQGTERTEYLKAATRFWIGILDEEAGWVQGEIIPVEFQARRATKMDSRVRLYQAIVEKFLKDPKEKAPRTPSDDIESEAL